MSRQEDALATLERLKTTCTPNSKNRGTGGRTDLPSTLSTALSELIGLLSSWSENTDVVLAGLRVLDVAFGHTQTATIVRLEGGLKVLMKLLRSYSADATILPACARAISSCIASSHVNQEVMAKEKGLPTLLLSCLAAQSREPDIAKPLLEVVVGISRTHRGAQGFTAGDTMVLLTKDLLITLMGSWDTWGLVLKALKLQAKQEGCAAMLMSVNQGEVSRILLAVSRLLVRIPGQYKLLKRVSRTLWLLHGELLPTLPSLEPLVPLPSRDAPHLAGLPSVLVCTETHQHRVMELVPEEYAAELQLQYERCAQQQRAVESQGAEFVATVDGFELLPAARSPHPARVWRHRHHLPPSAKQCAAEAPGPPEPFHSYEATQTATRMLMHDLRRIVTPADNLGRVVYDNTCQEHEAIALGSALQGLQCNESETSQTQVAPCNQSSSSIKQQQEALRASEHRTAMVYAERLRCTATTNGTALQSPPLPLPHATKHTGLQSLPPLSFQSDFESGNLRMAIQVSDNEYDLFLAPDLNDRSDGGNLCQWFYFSLTGVQPGVPYKFNLVNLRKKQSLFSNGKQPLVCRAAQRSSSGVTNSNGSHSGNDTAAGHGGSNGSLQVDEQLCDAFVPDVEGRWVRAGAYVSYYPSPYRGRQQPTAGSAVTATVVTTKRASNTGKKGSTNRKVSKAGSSAAVSELTASSLSSNSSSGRKKEQATKDVSGSSNSNVGPGLYAASFILVFPQPGTYYLASCYPYTYTDLQEYLDSICTRLAAQPLKLPATILDDSQQLSSCPVDIVEPISHLTPAAVLTSSCLPSGQGPSLLGGIMVRAVLGYSLAGHAVELLTITDFSSPPDAVAARECVVITARVHPGETCASWIMQGMIDFLTSDDPSARLLRSSFVFKLVPMMNADGVVNGSYRCSLSGYDLNRVWEKPSRSVHPCIYHAKHLLQALASGGEGRLALFIDIHGHSCKEDVFFYGCEPALTNLPPSSPCGLTKPSQAAGSEPDHYMTSSVVSSSSRPGSGPASSKLLNTAGSTAQPISAKVAARLRVRMLPYLMSKVGSHWSMSKSSWRIRRSKLGAARVVSHRRLGCAGAYTLEASLAGCSATRSHFSLHDYLSMGAELGRAVARLAEVDDEALLQEMAAALTLPPYSAAYTA